MNTHTPSPSGAPRSVISGSFPRLSPLLPALALLCALLCTGCGAILSPGPAPARMQLRPDLPAAQASGTAKQQLIVAMPFAQRDVDTDAIALVFHGREVRYLADTRWTAPAPILVQRSLIDALAASRAFRGVADESAGINAGLKLLCDVRQFGLRYADENSDPTAEVQLSLRLLSLADGAIVASLETSATASATGSAPADLVQACEKAFSKALAEITPWAVSAAQRAKGAWN